MNTFNKKSLFAALAGVTALGGAGVAEAVSVNPDGLGQVLIYPYYTVREKAPGAAFNSLLSVVNSTGSVKAVKVRFLEGKASQEVLDFNLYLSPRDVWTAAIVPTAAGAGIITADTSCTQPRVSSTTPEPFRNYQYSGDPVNDDSLDRTREGYVELIEMGDVVSSAGISAVTHTSARTPPNCNYPFTVADIGPSLDTRGLFGGVTLINVLSGEDFTSNATALADFFISPDGVLTLWTPPGDLFPNLGDVFPPESNVLDGNVVTTTVWDNPIDAVSAVFMHNSVKNEYVLDKITRSETDWVVTMPTKRNYYDRDTGQVFNLFQRNLTSSGACDDVTLAIWDREEQTTFSPIDFSPPPPVRGNAICWEANVITFNARNTSPLRSNVFGSTNVANINTTFESGWLDMSFPVGPSTIFAGDYHTLIAPDGTFFIGLPVVGFTAITYNNGTLASADGKGLIQSQYGGSFSHRFTRLIGFIGDN